MVKLKIGLECIKYYYCSGIRRKFPLQMIKS